MGTDNPQYRTADMALFDQLGPLARDALAEAPLEADVRDMLKRWRNSSYYPDTEERLWGAPYDHPEMDRRIADFVREVITKRVGPNWRPATPRRVRHGRSAFR